MLKFNFLFKALYSACGRPLKDVYPDTWETHLKRTNHESETQQDSIDPDLIDYTIDVNRTDVKTMLKHIYINNLAI